MQQWGENHWETYSPAVNMLTVKLLLAIAKLHGLEYTSIDFVLVFPQANLDIDIWMELPILASFSRESAVPMLPNIV